MLTKDFIVEDVNVDALAFAQVLALDTSLISRSHAPGLFGPVLCLHKGSVCLPAETVFVCVYSRSLCSESFSALCSQQKPE